MLPNYKGSIKYRPDIDGLRALAVLSVVCFHLGLPLHGGFVGVDMFFTISGFLIGSIILSEIAEQRFTLAAFYERRVRRIFPALFVLLACTSFIAYKLLLPAEFIDFAKSLLAAVLSSSNIYFWTQSSYFNAPASTKLLLHTWSLAVEEQFYLVLPVMILLVKRFCAKYLDLSIYFLAAVSFAISAYGAYHFPNTTFYWAHTRAWELLLGVMLGLGSFPKIYSAILRNAAGICGLLLILLALLFLQPWTPFPGLAAVPPCLGTALIIAAGHSGSNIIGRLLSLRPLVFIGLISYSLYLWHWPLIVVEQFGLVLVDGLSKHQNQAFVFLLSLVMATLSWRFIEIPVRTKALRLKRGLVFQSAAIAIACISVFSVVVVKLHGLPHRFPPGAQEVAEYLDSNTQDNYRNGICFITSQTATLSDYKVNTCLPDKPHQPKLLILGDSHAAALWWGLDQVYSDVNVMQATASGCKPVIHQRPRQYASCVAVINYALESYLTTHKVDAVLIEAHWDQDDLQGVGDTLDYLRKRNIPAILCGPIVQYDASLPRLLALSITQRDPSLPSRHRLQFVAPLDTQMAVLAKNTWHVPYISLLRLLCDNTNCTEYAAPNVPIQLDYGHLTRAGSVLMAEKIKATGIVSNVEMRQVSLGGLGRNGG